MTSETLATVGPASRSKIGICDAPRHAVRGLEHDPLVLAERAVDVHGHVVQVPERRHHSGLAVGERGGELQLGRQPDRLPRPEERSFSTAP